MAPHLLDGLQQPLVELERGELDLDLPESAAAGIARRGQQPAGGREVVRNGGAGRVASGVGRRQAGRGPLAAEQDVPDEGGAIEGARQRPTHPRIIERRPIHVEAQERGVEKRVDSQDGGAVAPVDGDLG